MATDKPRLRARDWERAAKAPKAQPAPPTQPEAEAAGSPSAAVDQKATALRAEDDIGSWGEQADLRESQLEARRAERAEKADKPLARPARDDPDARARRASGYRPVSAGGIAGQKPKTGRRLLVVALLCAAAGGAFALTTPTTATTRAVVPVSIDDLVPSQRIDGGIRAVDHWVVTAAADVVLDSRLGASRPVVREPEGPVYDWWLSVAERSAVRDLAAELRGQPTANVDSGRLAFIDRDDAPNNFTMDYPTGTAADLIRRAVPWRDSSAVLDVDWVSDSTVHLRTRAGAVTEEDILAWDGVVAVQADSGMVLASSSSRALAATAAEPQGTGATGLPTDGLFADQWALRNTGGGVQGVTGLAGADVNWLGTVGESTGAGTTIAWLDSGVATAHPDLAAASLGNTDEACGDAKDDDGNGWVDDCFGWDFVNNDPTIDDVRTVTGALAERDHGTSMVGLAAAGVNDGGIVGLAPGANHLIVKVAENGAVPAARVARAIRYAVETGADVIVLGVAPAPASTASTELREAIIDAADAGVVVVLPAGNTSTNLDGRALWGIRHDAVLIVGGHSNSGSLVLESNSGQQSVDLLAPGQFIAAPRATGHALVSGTSFAAAHAAAGVALVRGADPQLTGVEAAAVMLRSGTVDVALARSSRAGARLNAGAAVQWTGSVEPLPRDETQPAPRATQDSSSDAPRRQPPSAVEERESAEAFDERLARIEEARNSENPDPSDTDAPPLHQDDRRLAPSKPEESQP